MQSPFFLAADIGGTHARFMLFRAEGERPVAVDIATLAVAAHATPEVACAAFLARTPGARIQRACFAVAGPVEGRRANLTNAPWCIDADALAIRFAIPGVIVCNDFEAAASGIAEIGPAACVTLQEAVEPDEGGPRLLIGAGTGLGVAYVFPDDPAPRIVAGEGGHAGFAPGDDEQVELLRFVATDVGRVTDEHLLSGKGLARLYAFACRDSGKVPDDVRDEGAAAVAQRFAAGEPAARRALALFASIFGAVAGDHALCVLATGGVYIAGGIAPRFADVFAEGAFIAAFRAKGDQAALMMRMPVRLVRDDRLGLFGAARRAIGDESRLRRSGNVR